MDARTGDALAPDGRVARSGRRHGHRTGDRRGARWSGADLSLGRHRRARSRLRARHRYAGAGWDAARRPAARNPEDRPTHEFGRNGPCRGLAPVRSFGDHRPERQSLHTRRDLGPGREEVKRSEAVSTVAEPIAPGRVVELIAKEEERFRSKRHRSAPLWKQPKQFIPRGVPSSFQDAAPQPVFGDHGKVSRIWDVDGNEYVDFHNGFGVMVVGHAHPLIVKAISERAALGTHFAQPVADDAIVAEELSRRFKQPQWRFTNSGTESTLDAVRLARGFTGRDRLIKIEASYHGHHDALLVSVEPPPDLMGPPDAPVSVPYSGGTPQGVVGLGHGCPCHGP